MCALQEKGKDAGLAVRSADEADAIDGTKLLGSVGEKFGLA